MSRLSLFFVCAIVVVVAAIRLSYSEVEAPSEEFVPVLQKGMRWEIVCYKLVDLSHAMSASMNLGTEEMHLKYKVDDFTARDGKQFVRVSVYLDDPFRRPKVPEGQSIGGYIIDAKTRRVQKAFINDGGKIPEGLEDYAAVDGEKPVFEGGNLPLEMAVWPDLKDPGLRAAREVVYADPDLRGSKVTQSSFVSDLPGPSGRIHCLAISLISDAKPEQVERGYRTQLWVQGVPWWIQWRSVPISGGRGPYGRVIYARLVRWQDAQGKVHEIPQGQLPLGIFP